MTKRNFSKTWLLLLTIFLCNNHNLFCGIDTSKVQIIFGDKHFANRNTEFQKIIGYDETGFYVLRKEFRYVLEHYDNNLNLTKAVYPKLYKGLTTFELEYSILFHGELYLFTSTQRIKKKVLHVETINKITLEQNNDRRVFAEFQNFSGNYADFHFELSKREQKLLVCGQILAFWKRTIIQEVFVLDKDLSVDWKKRKTFIFNQRIPSERKFFVDDNGNAYLLGQTYQVGLFNFNLDMKNQFLIIGYTNKGEDIERYYIKLSGKFIRELLMESGNDNNLFCAGLFSESARYGVSGAMCFTVDNNINKITGQNFVYLDPELSQNILTEEVHSKQVMVSHKANYLHVRKNGNFVLGVEQQLNQNYENYNDIILFCFRPNGELAWRNTIFKKQSYNELSDEIYCSYAMFAPLDENKIEILYNDNFKNYSLKPKKRLRSFSPDSKSCLIQVEIDVYGQASKHVIHCRKKRETTPFLLEFYDSKTNSIIILNKRHIKYKYSKLVF